MSAGIQLLSESLEVDSSLRIYNLKRFYKDLFDDTRTHLYVDPKECLTQAAMIVGNKLPAHRSTRDGTISMKTGPVEIDRLFTIYCNRLAGPYFNRTVTDFTETCKKIVVWETHCGEVLDLFAAVCFQYKGNLWFVRGTKQ